MIRKSAFVAVLAIVLSLVVHLLALSTTSSGLAERSSQQAKPNTVELNNTFEDLAETPAEPVEPEPAEVPEPEPPVETPPEPEPAEIPTSEALVASPDPQRVYAPDTGAAPVVQPEAPEPQPSEPADQPDGEEQASDSATETPPAETGELVEIPEGNPDAIPPATAPEPETLAALPATEAPPVPVVPLENEAVDPEIPDASTEPETEASEQAVVSSIRPRLPERPPSTERQGAFSGSKKFDDLRFPQEVIESPLRAYQREGLDAFKKRTGRTASGGRGPGNSDVTNYAGEVLVHLNRTPVVYVSARGFAQVFFEINPDGTLAWVDVVDSSGSAEIDRAAKDQVRRASPFPPPPGGVSRKLSFFYQK